MSVRKNYFSNNLPGLGILLVLLQPALAFEDQGLIELQTDAITEEEQYLRGIVFDRTVTQTGLKFYQAFTKLWQMESIASAHTLTLRETPTARYGSILWLETGSEQLHRLTIGFRNQDVDSKAATSLQIVRDKLRYHKLN